MSETEGTRTMRSYEALKNPEHEMFATLKQEEAALADLRAKIGVSPALALGASEVRKMQPVGAVVNHYFPRGLRGVAAVAWVGNEKHNPGEPLYWAEEKSNDHADCLARHSQDAAMGEAWDTVELPDGRVYQVLHAAAAAWRALALAEIEARKHPSVVRRIK